MTHVQQTSLEVETRVKQSSVHRGSVVYDAQLVSMFSFIIKYLILLSSDQVQ
jgi:hypothetical protein